MPRTPSRPARPAAGDRQAPSLSKDSQVAADVKVLIVTGQREAARELFAELVGLQQRRASRIAFAYLRDVHDADEAVQDAFIKVFTHIASYREDLPFEVWFTRVLVNGCLDLRKARARRLRWSLPMAPDTATAACDPPSSDPSPEDRLVSRDRGREIRAAVQQLPDRQRTVFSLCQISEQSTSEVSQALGLSEATVRVHMFRAIRKLRCLLER